MTTLDDIMSQGKNSRDNNYNLLRFLAASFIAFYHCYFMALGHEMNDQKFPVLYEASQIVLNFFFITSGFLIAQSFVRRSDLISYIVARALRLIPGIFVLSIVLAFIVGPLVTEISLVEYFSSLGTWTYVPATTILIPDARLPGVFVSNVNPNEIDEALWTLRYEVICYVGLAFLGVLGALHGGRKLILASVFTFVTYIYVSYLSDLRDVVFINHMMHFGLSFFIGTLFFVYRKSIPLHWYIALAAGLLSYAAYKMIGKLAEPLVIAATAYIVFWLAYVPSGFIRRYNRFGDYSYGVYIYHFPVEQIFMFLVGGFAPLGLFVVSLPVSIFIAVISWIYVEKPWLSKLLNISNKTRDLFPFLSHFTNRKD